jgi:Ankyrin repeats (many copies)
VDRCADVLKEKNRQGYLPLHVAAQFGSLEKVQFLVHEHPSALTAETAEGLRAVDLASQNSNPEVAKWLEGALHERDPGRARAMPDPTAPPSGPSTAVAENLAPLIEEMRGFGEKLDSTLPVLARLDRHFNNEVPRLFIIVPADIKSGWKRPKSWLKSNFSTKYYLYFLCEVSHEVVSPPIKLTAAKDWVRKIAPVLVNALFLLQIAMKVGLNVSLDLHDAASEYLSSSWKITTGDVEEMLKLFSSFIDKSSNLGLLDTIQSHPLSSKAIQELSGDAYELVRAQAVEQTGWRTEMEPVRKLNTAGVLWVTRTIATNPTLGFEIVKY